MFKARNGWTKKKMIAHLKANFKGRSVDKEGDCVYRNDDGKSCAVGVFIPDSLYKRSMESKTAHTVYHGYSALQKVLPLSAKGLECLQQVHDCGGELESLIAWVKRNVA